ncbi:hypothetical protein QFZ24_009615 [Streptomyces phaeochromogenes]|nr:hypothetical protein [Streptomyces phaeochromogenes]
MPCGRGREKPGVRLFSGDGLTGLPPRRTKGVLHDLVARYLEIDEAITVDSQEAMFLTLGGTGPRRPFAAGAGTAFLYASSMGAALHPRGFPDQGLPGGLTAPSGSSFKNPNMTRGV